MKNEHMKKGIYVAFISIFIFCFPSFCQTLHYLDSSQTGVSFRGMSIATDGAIWVSGNKGTIGRSTDEGKNWTWVRPAGFEKRDFRDIEAFSATSAIAMAVDSPGLIIRTTDAGATWKVVYENHTSGIFLDDMCFRNPKEGICAGDPLKDGRLVIIATRDGGETWQNLADEQRPLVEKGEAMFAASGGNISTHPSDNHAYILVTGGALSRLWTLYPFKKEKKPAAMMLPVKQGGQMTGANAVFVSGHYIMIAAGDYNEPARSDSNFTVKYKNRPPKLIELAGGYRSSITDNGNAQRVACGISGISVHEAPFASYPLPWRVFSNEPFNVVRTKQGSQSFWLAGSRGRIALLTF
jgi:hypothetical protein